MIVKRWPQTYSSSWLHCDLSLVSQNLEEGFIHIFRVSFLDGLKFPNHVRAASRLHHRAFEQRS